MIKGVIPTAIIPRDANGWLVVVVEGVVLLHKPLSSHTEDIGDLRTQWRDLLPIHGSNNIHREEKTNYTLS